MTDYDMRVLHAVRRAVIGLAINDDWDVNPWVFNHRVRLFAQLALLDMSPEDLASLPNSHDEMQMFYQVLDTVEQQIGARDTALAHLIVAMYCEVLTGSARTPSSLVPFRKA